MDRRIARASNDFLSTEKLTSTLSRSKNSTVSRSPWRVSEMGFFVTGYRTKIISCAARTHVTQAYSMLKRHVAFGCDTMNLLCRLSIIGPIAHCGEHPSFDQTHVLLTPEDDRSRVEELLYARARIVGTHREYVHSVGSLQSNESGHKPYSRLSQRDCDARAEEIGKRRLHKSDCW